MKRWIFILVASLALGQSALGWDVRISNVSDEDLWVTLVEAPEFAYPVSGGAMRRHGKGSATSGEALKNNKVPKRVVISVRGRDKETVAVPPLPRDARGGNVTLEVVYTRSRRWQARWIVGDRYIPEENDSKFRQYTDLVDASARGDLDAVRKLLEQGAPVHWDTMPASPLMVAASSNRPAVVALLLDRAGDRFDLDDLETAAGGASGSSHRDIAALRLLFARFGDKFRPAAHVSMLRSASMSIGRDIPVGPAIYFLIDEANLDVNMPLSDSGHTLLDTTTDPTVIAFLQKRGARKGFKPSP